VATQSSRRAPDTPEERQAQVTVGSVKDVLAEIGELSRMLTAGALEQNERIAAKRELFEASERMCNLMSLAIYQVDNNVGGDLQAQLAGELDRLRERLLVMGTNLMVEKLRKIGVRAEAVLREGNYPLGLAGKLDMAYSALVSNLTMLKGFDRLGDEERATIEVTKSRIVQLASIERGLGLLVDVSRDKPRRSRAIAG
jgi:hypothetical protein